jgi:ubiquitin carboxyl-terminal hydrolase 4/11/15
VTPEGLNAFFAGEAAPCREMLDCLRKVPGFETLHAKESWSARVPFKRFKGGRQAYSWAFSYGSRVAKIETAVNFPREGLDMAPYLLDGAPADGSSLYDLYAVSCHSGGVGGGHYYAKCLLPDGRWAEYNDTFAGFVDPIKYYD